ncbi:MAG TPA: L,D-transpeptidase [Candidatus Polarisedimenticolia bacterium]|nr:L,D-transpeptidase [Candidatus Polarisedimenticolia bacterium]
MKILRLDPAVADAAPPPSTSRPHRSLGGRLARAAILMLTSVALVSAGLVALRWSRGADRTGSFVETMEVPAGPKEVQAAIASLEKEVARLAAANKKLEQRIRTFHPRGQYVVIDTGANKLYLMRDGQVVLDALVSTGSGVRLSDPDKPRSWVFDTPRGEFVVRRKVNEPVWTKPDWAFVEAGENVPRNWTERLEEGVLGDYALDLGDGYLIHGTIFERALGLHVTHGCVRVGAKALEELFRSVGVGTKVYIV